MNTRHAIRILRRMALWRDDAISKVNDERLTFYRGESGALKTAIRVLALEIERKNTGANA